jgi:DNA-binding response OmpR family regulator
MDEPKRVLIIDDDKHISELLRLYFEKDGFNVTAGYTGDTVLPLVRAVNPDVIILDLMLPGMSGFDVIRELRRESDVPVLMLTARSDTLDKIVGIRKTEQTADSSAVRIDNNLLKAECIAQY